MENMAPDPAPSAVTRRITLPASGDELWRAITDPSRLGDWLGGAAAVVVEAGATGTLALPDGDRSVLVTRVEEGREVSMLWGRASDGEVSAVSFEVEPVAGGAELTVTERLLVPAARIPAVEARWGGVVL